MASVREEFYFLVLCVCLFFVPTSRKPPSPPSCHWKAVLGYQCPQSQVPILLWCILPPASYPVDIRKERPPPAVCCPFRSLVNSPFILFTFSGLLLRALSLPASCFNSSTFLHQRASTHLSFLLLPAFKGQEQRSPLLWSCGRFPDWQERLYSLSFHIDFSLDFFLTFISLSPFPLYYTHLHKVIFPTICFKTWLLTAWDSLPPTVPHKCKCSVYIDLLEWMDGWIWKMLY